MFDATMEILAKTLDMRMRSHELHTANLANANVPDYKARKIDFDGRMQEAIRALDEDETPQIAKENKVTESIHTVEADVYEDPIAVKNGNGNTVNQEREQAELAKNTLAYETAVQLMNKKFQMQKLVVGGEGGR